MFTPEHWFFLYISKSERQWYYALGSKDPDFYENEEIIIMKKTKIAAVALVAVMALSMTACSETEETAAEASAEETVVETTVEETEAVETTAEETEAAETTVEETEATETTEANIDEDLVGTWSGEIEGASVAYTFNDDATGSMLYNEEGQEMEVPFTYNIPEEGTIVLVVEMFGETDSDDASYEVNGDTLTITDGDESLDFTRE